VLRNAKRFIYVTVVGNLHRLPNMIEIEKYYNKNDWENLVDLCRDNWIDNEQQIELLDSLKGLKDLAIVIWTTHKFASQYWIGKEIPALDNLRPIDCIENERLLRRLKVCLLRTP